MTTRFSPNSRQASTTEVSTVEAGTGVTSPTADRIWRSEPGPL